MHTTLRSNQGLRPMARRLLLSALVVLMAGCSASPGKVWTGAAPARSDVPTEISNAEFWRMVSEYSEAGGDFSSDNFTSNEPMVGEIVAALERRGIRGGVYIGVGPEQNFSYIAEVRPEIAFIVDIRRQAIMQHLLYKALFELSEDRSEFLSRLFSRRIAAGAASPSGGSHDSAMNGGGSDSAGTHITQLLNALVLAAADSAFFASNMSDVLHQLTVVRGFNLNEADRASLRYVYEAFYRLGPFISYRGFAEPHSDSPHGLNFFTLAADEDADGVSRSFLASEESYQIVTSLQMRNLVVPVVGDFGGAHAIRRVGSYMWDKRATLSTFYTSNVEQYLFSPNNNWHEFYANVQTLPMNDATLFVRPKLGGNVVVAGGAAIVVSGANTFVGAGGADSATFPSGAPPLDSRQRTLQRGFGEDALCPIERFMMAYNTGKVQSYPDALLCPVVSPTPH